MSKSKSLRPIRGRGFTRMALAAGAGVSGLGLLRQSAYAADYSADTTYAWNNINGGSWAASGPSNWNDTTYNISSSFNNLVVFNTSGAQYITTVDVTPNNGIFNLNSLTSSLGTASDSVELEGAPASNIDTLNFGPDSAGNAPQLVVNNTGTFNVQTPMIFSAGSNINVSGSANLSLGSGNQGFFNFGNGTIISNSGSGNLLLGQTGTSTVAQKFTFGNNTAIINSGPGTITLGDGATYSNGSAGVLTLENLGNASGGTFNIGNLAEGIGGTLNIIGPITFAGSTAGNLFGNYLILNVEANSSFNFASNPETMGGIEGNGNIIMGTAGITVTETAAQAGLSGFSYNGSISGTGAFAVDNASIMTLGGSNTYTGITTIEGNSTVVATAPNAFSNSSNVSVTAGTFATGGFNQSIGGLSGSNQTASLPLGSGTLTINASGGSTFLFQSPLTGTGGVTLIGAGTEWLSGFSTYTGVTNVSNGTLRTPWGSSSSIIIGTGATLETLVGSNATAVPISGTGGNLALDGGSANLNISSGNPNLALAGVFINGGSLTLNHTTDNTSEIGSVAGLNLGSGTLAMVGNASAPSGQTFASLTLLGGGQVSVQAPGAANANIGLGAITRAGYGSTVNFVMSNASTGLATISTTTSNNPTFGTIGAYATVNGTSWAVSNNSAGTWNITPLPQASYSTTVFQQSSATTVVHNDVTASVSGGNFSGSTLTAYASDLRYNASGSYTVTLGSPTDYITDGGILVTPNVGAHTSTISGNSNAHLTTPAGQDLIINQNNTQGAFNVSAYISNTVGASIQSSNVSITAGSNDQTLTLVSTTGILIGDQVTATGGTNTSGGAAANPFNASNDATVVAVTPTTVTISYATAPANASTGNTVTFTADTNVVKSGPGLLNLLESNTFKGVLVLNQGIVLTTADTNLGSASSGTSTVYFNGGTLESNAAKVSTGDGIQNFIIGPGGATMNVPSGDELDKEGSTVWGSGDISITGGGTFDIGSDGSTYNGRIFVNNGSLRLTSNQIASCTGITIANGSNFVLLDTTSGPFNIATGASLILNGNGPATGAYASTGAWYHVLDEAGSAKYAFNSPVVLQSTSRFFEQVRVDAPFDTNTDIFPYSITGPGGLIKDGPGTLILDSSYNSYGAGLSAPTIISNGTLMLGVNNAIPANTNVQFGEASAPFSTSNNNTGTLDLNGFSQTVSNLTVSGNGSGAGTQTTQQYTQQIINSNSTSGTLILNYNSSSPGGFSGSLGGTTISTAVNPNSNANNFSVLKSGTGSFTFYGTGSYTGTTNVSGGTLTGAVPTAFGTGNFIINPTGMAGTAADAVVVNSTNSIGTTAAVTVLTNSATATGTLNFYGTAETIGSLSGNGSVVLANTSGTSLTTGNANNSTFTGVISDVNGTGSLILQGTGAFTLTSANPYGGGTTVNGGTLTGTVAGAFGTGNLVVNPTGTSNTSADAATVNTTYSIATTANVTVNTNSATAIGTINFNGITPTIGSLSGTGSVFLANTSGATLTTGNSTNTVFSGTLSAAASTASMVKVGSGRFTLGGSNTYGGGTNVSAGTLLVTNTVGSATGAGPVIVGPAGSLGGSGIISGTVTVNGTIAPGLGNTSVGTVLTIGSGSVLAGATLLDLTAASVSDEIEFGTGGTGTANLGGTLRVVNTTAFPYQAGETFTLLGFATNSATGTFSTPIQSALPTLASPLSWNTSTFYENGTVSVNGPVASSGIWASAASGAWETAGNWVSNTAPTGAGQTASFGDSIGSGSATVTLTAPEVVGVLNFNGSAGGAYTIAGSNTLALSSGTSAPAIVSVNAGTQTITAPITLTAGLNVNTAIGSSLVIGGPVTGGTGALTVTSGSTLTIAPAGLIGVPLVVAGTVNFANQSTGSVLVRNVPSLNVSGTFAVQAGSHASRQLISTAALSLAPTGSIDLSDNDLLLQAGGAVGLTQVRNLVAQAYAGGTWQGIGGITSSAAAGDTTHLTTLGVILNDIAGTALMTTFDGAPTADGDVLVKYTYYGDTNLNGQVDGSDYSRIDNGYISQLTGWFNGDFNYDGVIDGSDYTLIDNAYNTQGASLAAEIGAGSSAVATAQIAGSAAVPEPATLALLAVGAMGLLGRRRRA